mmetsp:Transcript_7281/g.32298  ORF Transcript_7281/g.32298 Transcript_7281/m.32298 type:complete len:83 (-) Transcript_7281:754-1002(-)
MPATQSLSAFHNSLPSNEITTYRRKRGTSKERSVSVITPGNDSSIKGIFRSPDKGLNLPFCSVVSNNCDHGLFRQQRINMLA